MSSKKKLEEQKILNGEDRKSKRNVDVVNKDKKS